MFNEALTVWKSAAGPVSDGGLNSECYKYIHTQLYPPFKAAQLYIEHIHTYTHTMKLN